MTSSARSALAYVPFVLGARGLAFFRNLVVARLLGDAGQAQFGLYQPALELINWIVPLVMLGLADVAERYAFRLETEGRLPQMLRRHLSRILALGILASLLLVSLAPFIARFVWRSRDTRPFLLLSAIAATILLLALYQYLAALLRGLRAYSASAGLEFSSALLLFLFSALAAHFISAFLLILAYAASILLPLLLYGFLLARHLRSLPADPAPPSTEPPPRYSPFAAWTLLRLLLVMTFGFLAIWSVGFLTPPGGDPQSTTAAYAMPYRIAQLLAYFAITLWSSSYAIAARAWSGGQHRRARAQLFRVGRFGAAALLLLALLLLPARPLLAALLPSVYTPAIEQLLAPFLALFIWYSLLAFFSTYGDLQERPYKGAALWAAAVLVQLAAILAARFGLLPGTPDDQALTASSLGLAASLFLLAPLILCRPWRFAATAMPLILLALAPLALFAPWWVVNYLAIPLFLAILAFLYLSGLLVRPLDRRSLRKFLINA
jgi:O-antigen/teichoic acid export membrane protein